MRLFIFSLIAIIGLAAVLMRQHPDAQHPESAKIEMRYEIGLPWQITLANGNSSVFGLTLGSSTLKDAMTQLGGDNEFALLAKANQLGSLDLYYSHFRTGPIQGKLIISAAISEAGILAIKSNPGKQAYLENGTKKYSLSTEQREKALKLPIKSITLAPAANIDEAIILDRFGSPTQIIKINDQVSHYVYESLGLAVRIDTKGKDMLHYVSVSPPAITHLISQLESEALENREE